MDEGEGREEIFSLFSQCGGIGGVALTLSVDRSKRRCSNPISLLIIHYGFDLIMVARNFDPFHPPPSPLSPSLKSDSFKDWEIDYRPPKSASFLPLLSQSMIVNYQTANWRLILATPPLPPFPHLQPFPLPSPVNWQLRSWPLVSERLGWLIHWSAAVFLFISSRRLRFITRGWRGRGGRG